MIRFGGSRAWDFQDCFADLKEPNCEGYLKRPANNSRQLRLYGMLKRLPEKHIPEFSDPYEHKLCAFHRQPMHLSDTAFKYRSPTISRHIRT